MKNILRLALVVFFTLGFAFCAQAQPGPGHHGHGPAPHVVPAPAHHVVPADSEYCECSPNGASCHCIRNVRPAAPRIVPVPPAPPAPKHHVKPKHHNNHHSVSHRSCRECEIQRHACYGDPRRCDREFDYCISDCR